MHVSGRRGPSQINKFLSTYKFMVSRKLTLNLQDLRCRGFHYSGSSSSHRFELRAGGLLVLGDAFFQTIEVEAVPNVLKVDLEDDV